MKLIKTDQRGFTIVELLIVIVVIGILAAIVTVAFNGIQNRATETTVQSDLRNAANIVKQQQATTGTVPTTLTAAMGIKITKTAYLTNRNNLYYCVNTSTQEFVFAVQSKTNKLTAILSSGGYTTPTSVNSIDTCTLVGLTATGSNGTGYDFSGGSGWASWVN